MDESKSTLSFLGIGLGAIALLLGPVDLWWLFIEQHGDSV